MTQRTAIVCGCAHGIGEAGARELAKSGWRLALVDRDPGVAALAERIGAAASFVVDTSDDEALAEVATDAIDRLGRLDAVWSNAGVQIKGSVEELSGEDWNLSWAVNVRAHAVLARATIPALREAGGGSILVTASNSGLLSESHLSAYSVTKAAAIALVRCMARDFASARIRVNALCPGYVDTSFNAPIWSLVGGRDSFLDQVESTIPLGRMATATEIGGLAAWLLDNDRARYITGQAIVADGGELVA